MAKAAAKLHAFLESEPDQTLAQTQILTLTLTVLKHRSIPYHTRFLLNVGVRTCILCGAGPCRAQNSMCKIRRDGG